MTERQGLSSEDTTRPEPERAREIIDDERRTAEARRPVWWLWLAVGVTVGSSPWLILGPHLWPQVPLAGAIPLLVTLIVLAIIFASGQWRNNFGLDRAGRRLSVRGWVAVALCAIAASLSLLAGLAIISLVPTFLGGMLATSLMSVTVWASLHFSVKAAYRRYRATGRY